LGERLGMKDNKELYEFIDRLIGELRSRGEDLYAERLRLAVGASSSVLEIFMMLRHELLMLRNANLDLSTGLTSEIDSTIESISVSLDR
jgi:hypothetical protein